jgi:hypothetical protein
MAEVMPMSSDGSASPMAAASTTPKIPKLASDGRTFPLIARIQRKPGKWAIRGVASTPTIDDHGTSLDPLGCVIRRLPLPLMQMHRCELSEGFSVESAFVGDHLIDQFRIGEVVAIEKDSSQVVIEAHVFSRYAWEAICGGALRCLSVGFLVIRERAAAEGGPGFIDQWELREVSIVARGANPDARFEILRGEDEF